MGADLRGVFDRAASTYDVAGVRLFTEMAVATAHLLPTGPFGCIVEVGAGTGALTAHLGGRGPVLATDASSGMLRELGRRVPEVSRLAVADAAQLPLKAGVADLVVASQVIQLLDSADAAVAEWARVLRPGGLLVISSQAERAGPVWEDKVAALLPARRARGPGRRWTDQVSADAVLTGAGFGQATHHAIDFEVSFADGEGFWQWCWSHGQRASMERIQVGDLAAVRAQVLALVGDRPVLPVRLWTVVASRS